MNKCLLIIFLLMSMLCFGQQRILNPLSFGLLDARTGVERYQVLLRCHQEACKAGCGVSYVGIDSIDLEIPKQFETIPLTKYTDFANTTITVLNNNNDVFLFTLKNATKPIKIGPKDIDQSLFSRYGEINKGKYLLIVEDANPWIMERIGYSHNHIRKDICIVDNGIGNSRPVMPYDNVYSKCICSFRKVKCEKKIFKNLKFVRNASSSRNTKLILVESEYNVLLKNIVSVTPKGSGITGDGIITAKNCVDFFLENVRINGTYSTKVNYGYGIALNNIYNFKALNVYGDGDWGVFGSDNVHDAFLTKCVINRFDIHCYGKNVEFNKCKFFGLYNQYSSVYGMIKYNHCSFENCHPYLNEHSYNAYVPVDIIFNSCQFSLTKAKNDFIYLMSVRGEMNSRPELSRKSLPNITIKNCTVNLADDVKDWYIVNTGKVTYKESLDYISKIEVNHLKINGNVHYKLFSTELTTTNPLKVVKKRVKLAD